MLREPFDDIALGIDFGTSECRAVVTTPDGQHELRVPALVSVDVHGRLIAGDAALAVAKRRPELGVRSIKRLLGRRVGSPEVAWLAAGTPQQLEQTARGLGVQLGGALFSVQAVAQVLLQDIVDKAIYPATPENGDVPAVLTIPAMFDMPQRLTLVRVATQSGIDVRRVVESPIAALLAMGLPGELRRVVVADFGAGYFDVCVASRSASGWTVLGAEGDPLLGTDDLDHRVVQLLIDHYYRQNQIDLSASSSALARLRRQARQIRQDASKRQPSATVLTHLARHDDKDVPLVHPALTGPDLDALWDEELGALVPPCLRLFEELGLGTDDIDALVLLGGAARLPFVQARFRELLRVEPIVPPDAPLLAARGAAMLARADASGPVVKSVLPHTLSVLAGSRTPVPITRKNQALPITSTHFFKPDDPHGGPIDLWLCQGEREHGYDACRVARAHLEEAGDGSYVVTVGVSESGDVSFHVQSADFAATDDGFVAISSIPPKSEEAPVVDVIAESLDAASLAAYIQSLEQEEEDILGGQPTIQARRLEPEGLPASSRPEHALRRSMYGRGAVVETGGLPHSSTQLDTSAPPSLPADADPLVGSVLGGRYEVTAIIGEGAMARVYKARHKILGNAYAVKVMHAALASDASLRERFLREARAAAAIDSDHVVRILDFGNADDSRDYFVMEFLEGRSLEDEIQEHLVPMPLVLTAMVQVARGLEAAHEHAIVHRDLKPENVWLTHSGAAPRIKILDFGVAKIPTAEAGLTMGNSIIGTPYYMAPEQVSGQVDHRTDIYATGIMLYELVTGRVPFHHESLAYVLAMQCDMPLPSPRAFAGPVRCSEELDALIRKCAEKNKDQRFQTARELRVSLEEIRARLAP